MRLPPISLLAFPLSPTVPSSQHLYHTILCNHNNNVQSDKQYVQPTNKITPSTKKKKKQKRPRYHHLTTRQKSIHRGNDPLTSLNLNLDHLAKSSHSSPLHAEEMLLRIEALHADGYYEKAPDVVSYNCVVHGYALKGDMRESERVVKMMEEKGIMANEITYNTLLRCVWMEIDSEKGGMTLDLQREKVEKAESIMNIIEVKQLSDAISYNTMISILAKCTLPEAPERAEYWLRRLMTQYDSTGEERFEPDVCSFNSVIHAYANSIDSRRTSSMISTKNLMYAQKAEELLEEMDRLYQSGMESVQPDVVSYSAVINAYARATSRENKLCAKRAVEVLEGIEKDFNKKGGVRPNKRTYSSVINALARVGNADAADNILSKMKQLSSNSEDNTLKPDTICYTSVIDAYSKKGGEDAADRAEELLREMEDLCQNGDLHVRPNTRTYCAVINALGKSGQPRYAEKAEKILNEMEGLNTNLGRRDLAPNTYCYNAVITAYARSTSVSKTYRAELLLEKMLEEYKNGNKRIRPDTISFNSVINAAAQSSGDSIVKKEAYLIALNAFKTLHSLDYCKPTSVTYSSFLKVLKNLVDDGDARDYMAKKVFALCASMNLDNDTVRLQLKRTCSSPVVLQQILELSR